MAKIYILIIYTFYFQCKKVEACIKHDMRNKINEFIEDGSSPDQVCLDKDCNSYFEFWNCNVTKNVTKTRYGCVVKVMKTSKILNLRIVNFPLKKTYLNLYS